MCICVNVSLCVSGFLGVSVSVLFQCVSLWECVHVEVSGCLSVKVSVCVFVSISLPGFMSICLWLVCVYTCVPRYSGVCHLCGPRTPNPVSLPAGQQPSGGA